MTPCSYHFIADIHFGNQRDNSSDSNKHFSMPLCPSYLSVPSIHLINLCENSYEFNGCVSGPPSLPRVLSLISMPTVEFWISKLQCSTHCDKVLHSTRVFHPPLFFWKQPVSWAIQTYINKTEILVRIIKFVIFQSMYQHHNFKACFRLLLHRATVIHSCFKNYREYREWTDITRDCA